MTNLINKIAKLAMIIPLAVGLNGCRDASNDFCKKGKYNEYESTISFGGMERRISIYSDIDNKFGGKAGISAHESIYDLKDKKRFLEIYINPEIPLENPIIKYANLDSLEKIYNYIDKNGVDCDEVKNKK